MLQHKRVARVGATAIMLAGLVTSAGCRGPAGPVGQPVVLSNAADRQPETISSDVFREGFGEIRQLLLEGRYDDAMAGIEGLAGYDLPSTLSRALGQLRVRCLRERFLARHPLSLRVEGPTGRGRWRDRLDLEFVVHNAGAEAVSIAAADGSLWTWLGLATAARSLLQLTVVRRTGDGRGLVQEKTRRLDVWLEEDLEVPAGGGGRIPYRLAMDAPEEAAWCGLEVRAVLLPLGIVAEGGDSIYLPLEYPGLSLEMFRDDEIDVLADPMAAIDGALASGDAERLFCAVMALDETSRVRGFDLLLGRLGRATPAVRRAGLAALRARTGRGHGQDLESWRGWWLSEGRAMTGR